MKKWEYAYEYISRIDVVKGLNELGALGWELVCMRYEYYIFKRELVENADEKRRVLAKIDRLRSEDFAKSAYEWEQQALKARREREDVLKELDIAIKALDYYTTAIVSVNVKTREVWELGCAKPKVGPIEDCDNLLIHEEKLEFGTHAKEALAKIRGEK